MKKQNSSENINIRYHSGMYTLSVKQQLAVSMDEAWEFFSSPENLSKITPSEMKFEITSGKPEKMFAGQIISYRIGILPMIKSHWVTEITQVKNKKYFIDEQRFGPYKMWHHEHHFKENQSGILMVDKVSYKIPFGFLGRIAHFLFIHSQLQKIFSYRIQILNEIFARD